MNEHELAVKIAEIFLASHDEKSILEIESMLLHFGHDEWKKGYLACSETVQRVIDKTFAKQSETP